MKLIQLYNIIKPTKTRRTLYYTNKNNLTILLSLLLFQTYNTTSCYKVEPRDTLFLDLLI